MPRKRKFEVGDEVFFIEDDSPVWCKNISRGKIIRMNYIFDVENGADIKAETTICSVYSDDQMALVSDGPEGRAILCLEAIKICEQNIQNAECETRCRQQDALQKIESMKDELRKAQNRLKSWRKKAEKKNEAKAKA